MPLIYEDLSYKINGFAFEVFRELGYGYKEKVYRNALAEKLKDNNLNYQKECPYKIIRKGIVLGVYFMDLKVENKLVVEIKRDYYFKNQYIKQLYEYLKATDLKLGLLICYSHKGVKIKRIVNIK